jgi:DNA adenine methylase
MPSTFSPFRYPGGKSQLYPFVKHLLEINGAHGTYIEPFAGGSAIGLKLLFENNVDRILINDFDASIYSVWEAILNYPDYLIRRIRSVPFDYYEDGQADSNIAYWQKEHAIYFEEKGNAHSLSGAFATLFLNRTNRSGIITGGPLGGWSQKNTKIGARFNKKTLIDKIVAIHDKRDFISLSNEDALELIPKIPKQFDERDTFVFFDPPYLDQGCNLYYSSLSKNDHRTLATKILSLKSFKWIVTYDYEPMIRDLYQSASGKYEYQLNYSANSTNRGRASEFLFSSSVTKMESQAKTVLLPI